jgi:hypothetical protein
MWLCFSTLQLVYLFDCEAINCTFVFQWIDMFCCRWQLEALNILAYWYWSWLSTKYLLTVINTTQYRESWQINQLLVIALACITQLIPYPGTGHDTSTSRHRLLFSSDIFSFPSFKTPLSKIFFNRSSSIYHDYHARYIPGFLLLPWLHFLKKKTQEILRCLLFSIAQLFQWSVCFQNI